MKIVFLGTGEAFDENNPNNSHLIISKEANLLLDCGFTTPYQLWKYNNDQNLLDAVYITHLHADHYFGLPALILRMQEEKRTKTLKIICQKKSKESIERVIDYGYSNLLSRIGFKIEFIEISPDQNIKLGDLKLSFAPTKHSQERKNLAIRVDSNGESICHSGDGKFTEETEELYRNSNLVIHEAYSYNKKLLGHGCVVDLIKMAERNNIKCLALTHINRNLRPKIIKKKLSSKKVKIIIPEPLEEYML